MNNLPQVAIVILNWNGKIFFEKFLQPLMLSLPSANCSVYIADNNSTDDSIIYVQNNFPQIKIISFDENYGFAKGYNRVLKQISADYYCLLNSDVEVSENWLQPLIDLMEGNKEIAVCQPKILSQLNKENFEYAGGSGGWIDFLGYPFCKGRVFDTIEKDSGQYNQTEEIFWASGAAFFVRANDFHAAGGFDEYFFAHQEEIDLCWRMKLTGKKVYACPASTVYHVGGGTLPQGNAKKTFLNFRNNLVLLSKNLPLSEKIWKLPFRLILDCIASLKELLAGNFSSGIAIFKAHFYFFVWLFRNKKNITNKPIPIKKLTGVYGKMIIIDYFLKSKKYFSEIIK